MTIQLVVVNTGVKADAVVSCTVVPGSLVAVIQIDQTIDVNQTVVVEAREHLSAIHSSLRIVLVNSAGQTVTYTSTGMSLRINNIQSASGTEKSGSTGTVVGAVLGVVLTSVLVLGVCDYEGQEVA